MLRPEVLLVQARGVQLPQDGAGPQQQRDQATQDIRQPSNAALGLVLGLPLGLVLGLQLGLVAAVADPAAELALAAAPLPHLGGHAAGAQDGRVRQQQELGSARHSLGLTMISNQTQHHLDTKPHFISLCANNELI